jgi:hypothetical protein
VNVEDEQMEGEQESDLIPPDKYKDLTDFYEDVETVGEIEFSYNGKYYTLCYVENGLSIAEYYKPETEQIFESPEDLAEKFVVDGRRFKDFVTEVEVLFH